MTKKDYELIAACLGSSLKGFSGKTPETLAVQDVFERITSELYLENPNFSKDKFSARVCYWKDIATGV